MKPLITSVWIVLLSGCASSTPDGVRTSLPDAPTVAETRSNIERNVGQRVRWGGQLVSVINESNRSLLEIVSRNLYRGGRPRQTDYSGGRFLAIFPGFVDPVIYVENREITIVGTINGVTSGVIGNFNYRYPVVNVTEHVLWQPIPERGYYPSGYLWRGPWYDPWYDPWPRRHRPYRY